PISAPLGSAWASRTPSVPAAGIPLLVVDAVQDARYGGAAGTEAVLEPHAVLSGADLARVSGTDRGDEVGVDDPVPQRVDPSAGEIARVQQLPRSGREPEIRDALGGEDALVADVVDGEHRAGRAKQWLARPHRAQEERRERRVPVVAMQNPGREAEPPARLERGAREGEEAQVLVGIAGVDRAARVELRTIDEVHGRASRQPPVEHREHVVVRPQSERQALEALDRLGLDARPVDGRIARGEEDRKSTR